MLEPPPAAAARRRCRIWGIGLAPDVAARTPEAQWRGLNLLGQALTLVREELKREFAGEWEAQQQVARRPAARPGHAGGRRQRPRGSQQA